MCRRRGGVGVTMVELMVIIGLAATVIGLLVQIFSSGGRADEKLTTEQRYERLQTLMFAHLKKDIRSALSVDRGDGVYSLKIFSGSETKCEIKTVVWEVDRIGGKVFRKADKQSEFDFSEFIPSGFQIRFELE